METKKLVDSILETVRAEISDFVEEESSIKCPIEYETRLIEIGRKVTKNLLQEHKDNYQRVGILKKSSNDIREGNFEERTYIMSFKFKICFI